MKVFFSVFMVAMTSFQTLASDDLGKDQTDWCAGTCSHSKSDQLPLWHSLQAFTFAQIEKHIMDENPDLNVEYNGFTPLEIAFRAERWDIVALLLTRGASLRRPLEEYERYGHWLLPLLHWIHNSTSEENRILLERMRRQTQTIAEIPAWLSEYLNDLPHSHSNPKTLIELSKSIQNSLIVSSS